MNTETVINQKTGERMQWNDVAQDTDVVLGLARVCHEANRGFCESLGDRSQPTWDSAPDWQKESAVMGVKFHLTGDHLPSESHESWMKQKAADGWVWGATKDPVAKTHPCMVPYEQLPYEQRFKDYLFRGIVHSFKEFTRKENTNG